MAWAVRPVRRRGSVEALAEVIGAVARRDDSQVPRAKSEVGLSGGIEQVDQLGGQVGIDLPHQRMLVVPCPRVATACARASGKRDGAAQPVPWLLYSVAVPPPPGRPRVGRTRPITPRTARTAIPAAIKRATIASTPRTPVGHPSHIGSKSHSDSTLVAISNKPALLVDLALLGVNADGLIAAATPAGMRTHQRPTNTHSPVLIVPSRANRSRLP